MCKLDDDKVYVRGRVYLAVFAEDADGNQPARSYLDSAEPRVTARFMALIKHFANEGRILNGEQCHILKDSEGIYELKVHRPACRLFFGLVGNKMVLTHGCNKPANRRAYSPEIKRAQDLIALHKEAKT